MISLKKFHFQRILLSKIKMKRETLKILIFICSGIYFVLLYKIAGKRTNWTLWPLKAKRKPVLMKSIWLENWRERLFGAMTFESSKSLSNFKYEHHVFLPLLMYFMLWFLFCYQIRIRLELKVENISTIHVWIVFF